MAKTGLRITRVAVTDCGTEVSVVLSSGEVSLHIMPPEERQIVLNGSDAQLLALLVPRVNHFRKIFGKQLLDH